MPIKKENANLFDLNDAQHALFRYFDTLNIAHKTYDHDPIFTVDEGKDLKKHIPGAHGKSLFITNKTGQYWLIIAKGDTRVDLKGLSDHLQTKRFSFGKPDIMYKFLGVTPGSVTPFALLHDEQLALNIIIDKNLSAYDNVVFHPLKNDKSTVISYADLLKFIESLSYDYKILKLDPCEKLTNE